MCKEGGGGQGEERHRHAQITDGQVDNEELGRLQHGPLLIGHQQEQRVPREGRNACGEGRGTVLSVTELGKEPESSRDVWKQTLEMSTDSGKGSRLPPPEQAEQGTPWDLQSSVTTSGAASH